MDCNGTQTRTEARCLAQQVQFRITVFCIRYPFRLLCQTPVMVITTGTVDFQVIYIIIQKQTCIDTGSSILNPISTFAPYRFPYRVPTAKLLIFSGNPSGPVISSRSSQIIFPCYECDSSRYTHSFCCSVVVVLPVLRIFFVCQAQQSRQGCLVNSMRRSTPTHPRATILGVELFLFSAVDVTLARSAERLRKHATD